MTDILAKISGQFSRSLILGAFLPSVVFALCFLLFAVPLLPADWPLFEPLEALGTEWKIVAISFATLVLSGVLYNLNIPIIRLFEGYPWKASALGARRTAHYTALFRALNGRWQGTLALIVAMPRDHPSRPEVLGQRAQYGQRMSVEFAALESLVLPTRLGNIIRGFENYPLRQYGIDSVALWPRLIAKIDKEYAGAIDEAKTSFDFMINSTVLSAALALCLLFAGLFYPTLFSRGWRGIAPWLLEIFVFAGLSRLAYTASLGRAAAWGEMVKGSFDLYRWDLLKQLGYTRVPATKAQERALWGAIARQLIYGDPPPRTLSPVYESKAVLARATDPAGRELTIARGVSPPVNAVLQVHVQVRNDGAEPAKQVIVTDTLPDGFDYVWDQAFVDEPPGQQTPVRVQGANPYQFSIGDLDPGRVRNLTYQIVQRPR